MSQVVRIPAVCMLTILIVTACASRPGDEGAQAAAPTPSAESPSTAAADPTPAPSTAPYAADEAAPFKALASETIAALDAGNKDVMIAKLTDLETLWDEKESVMSPRDPATWTAIDKALDRGISALRSSRTDLAKGRVALQDFISAIDRATKS